MKSRWKIAMGLAALATVCALWLFSASHNPERDLEQTRDSLRQQGFKLDRSEFALSTTPEMRARATVLSNAIGPNSVWSGMRGDIVSASRTLSNAAPVIWKEQSLFTQSSTNLWPELRNSLGAGQGANASRSNWRQVREAVLAGPLRFEPASLAGNRDIMWPHLSRLRSLELAFQARLLTDLHDGCGEEAWLDLLASTRLVTDWIPEPAAICQTVRCLLVTVAYDSTWEALQADYWSEEQLAQLQHVWETADFVSGLPETAAFTRASLSAGLEAGREQPVPASVRPPSILSDPEGFFSALRERQRQIHYRRQGSFDDERAMLLFYRDRELELRRAVACSTWQEMRALPLATNLPAYRSSGQGFGPRGGFRQGGFGGPGRRQGLLARVADSEARRRILVTALSLERYRRRHGEYPKTLDALAPECLKTVPRDFMDGKPLRYFTTDDGHYLLYSVGLDCTDNGGKASISQQGADMPEGPVLFDYQEGTDLVWPHPVALNPVEAQSGEIQHGPQNQLSLSKP